MAQLKSTHVTGDLSVTGGLSASTIIKLGGTSLQALMADGSIKNISTANQANTIVERDSTGTITAQAFSGDGSNLTGLSADNISSGTLPVSRGGTGATTFTSGAALIGAGTGAVTTRSITNNTSATAVTASTNLITANTLYYHKGNSNLTTVGTITSGTWKGSTIGVAYGGTGATTLTSGAALIGNGTGAIQTRSITNNTSKTAVTASTNLITANTLYYHSGNSNLTTVGTITSGTWQGTKIGTAYGGTGLTSFTANRLLYTSSTSALGQGYYANGTKMAIGQNTEPTETFYVKGSAGISNNLNAQTISVDAKVTMQYDSTNEYMYFTFA